MKIKRLLELLLALALLTLPVLTAQRAYAQILDNVICNGPITGAFCDLIAPDALTCEDCVQANCDADCLYAYGAGASGVEAYYYCVELGFVSCNGGSAASAPTDNRQYDTYYQPLPSGTPDPRIGDPQYGYYDQFTGQWHWW